MSHSIDTVDTACPKCGNRDPSLIELCETHTHNLIHKITLYEMACTVCSQIWNRRMSAIPHKKETHGQ